MARDTKENTMREIILYIHGKNGAAAESEHYAPLFPDSKVIGLDYQTFTPWETGREILDTVLNLQETHGNVTLIANSIGAFFSMNAGIDAMIRRAYFISPIVDMEKLIGDMMLWADAGTIIPWNVYMNYGDRQLLGYGFEIMKDYCNVLMEKEKADGDNGLILHGFTFGDWLAQDGICEQSLAGGTDNTFITNVYYWNSLRLTASAARELGASDLEKKYSERAEKVYNAILNEYFAPNGKLALGTQTAYVLSLYYGIYRNRDRIINDFRERLRRDFYKMKTGFTGTPLILLAMFDNGMDDDAYRILFNEECPGWLYAVNMGATTVWERWNSVLPDGRISGINMNSLNHYSYGSVCEAIYSRICGLKNLEPGWKKVLIKPHVNYRMKKAEIAFDSPMGKYKVSWKVSGGDFSLKVEIPFGTEGTVELPDGSSHKVSRGEYDFSCRLPEKLVHPFDLDTPNIDILANSRARALFEKHLPFAYGMVTGENEEFKLNTGRFLGYLAMFRAAPEDLQKYEAELKKIEP